MTAIKDRLSLVALADKLYKARDVEPVFKPVAPLYVLINLLVLESPRFSDHAKNPSK